MFYSGFPLLSPSCDQSTPHAALVEMKSRESVMPIEECNDVFDDEHDDLMKKRVLHAGDAVKTCAPGNNNIAVHENFIII